MQASINSFSTNVHLIVTTPTVEKVDTSNLPKSTVSSTTITFSDVQGLNKRIHKLLEEFHSLEDNWDGEDALAPSKDALNDAFYLTKILDSQSQPVFHAAPGPNGEVMIDLRNKVNQKSLEIIFYQIRSVAVFYSPSELPTQREFLFEDLPLLLEWLNTEK